MPRIYRWMGIDPSGFKSDKFVTSWFLSGSVLAAVRALFSIYCFITLFISLGWFALHDVTFQIKDVDIPVTTFTLGREAIGRSFGYFAYLSYWGLAFYFAVASFHTFTHAWMSYTALEYWPRTLQVMHSLLYSSVVTFPFLVSIIYWGTMWVGSGFAPGFETWNALSLHILNMVFAIFEIAVAQTSPLPWFHLVCLYGILTLCLPIAYITKATAGVYVYLWLDPQVGGIKVFTHLLGYTLATLVIFSIIRASIWVRCRLTRQDVRPFLDGSSPESGNNNNSDNSWTFQKLDVEKTQPRVREEAVEMTTLPEPERAHSAFPKRSSSFHTRNFALPDEPVPTKLSGFWM